jgi:hypothetical protein
MIKRLANTTNFFCKIFKESVFKMGIKQLHLESISIFKYTFFSV